MRLSGMAQDFLEVEVRSRAELRRWLTAHHAQADSIWLVSYKKGSPHYLPYDDIVEEALCFGWVDSQPRVKDAERSMRRLSPRKPGSGWSQPNKERVARLIASGRMTSVGLAVVEAAKASGAWAKIDHAQSLEMPPDLTHALAIHPNAEVNFASFPSSSRKAILEWIGNARTPATRAKRIEETARLADQNIRANQWRR